MPHGPRRRTTLVDVAQLAGVDKALVSKVVNGDTRLRIKDETRQRILDAIAALHYRPNRLARNLRLSRSSTIGLVVPSISDPVWADFVSSIEQHVNDAGLTLMTAADEAATGGTPRVAKFLDLLEENSLAALLLATPVDDDSAANLPPESVILIGQTAPTFLGRRVVVDDHHAVQLALDHLISLGHSRIVYLDCPGSADVSRRRQQAFHSTMGQHSLPADVLKAATVASMTLQLFSQIPRPTAVLTSSSIAGAGVLKAINDTGLRVPRDVSVICIHDLDLCTLLSPALTAVRLPINELARIAVHEAVSGTIRNELLILATGIEIILRESTSPPPTP